MAKECKYCGKEIDGVLPAPLTCWTCYKERKSDSEVISNHENSEVNITSTGSPTKECEMCKRVLPIDHFYKTGKERSKICKDCVVEESARRCIDLLNIANIRKMSASGINAAYLAKDSGRTRSTCQSMLSSLVKTDRAYKKVINGENKYYLDLELADVLIKEKRGESVNILPKNTIKKQSNDTKGESNMQNSDKGVWIKDVPILKLGPLLEEIRTTMDPNFSLNISTRGEYADIFLSDEQILNWGKTSFNHIVTNFLE